MRRERREKEMRGRERRKGVKEERNLTTSNLFVAGRIPLQVMLAVKVWSPSYTKCTHL